MQRTLCIITSGLVIQPYLFLYVLIIHACMLQLAIFSIHILMIKSFMICWPFRHIYNYMLIPLYRWLRTCCSCKIWVFDCSVCMNFYHIAIASQFIQFVWYQIFVVFEHLCMYILNRGMLVLHVLVSKYYLKAIFSRPLPMVKAPYIFNYMSYEILTSVQKLTIIISVTSYILLCLKNNIF